MDLTRRRHLGTTMDDIAALVGVAVAYFLLAKFGLMLASVNPSATPVWPPSGLAFAALMIFGHRIWPAVFVGAFAANALTAGSLATSTAIAAGNSLEAVVGVWLINNWSNGHDTFASPVGVAKFAMICLGPSTMISATIGVVSSRPGRFCRLGEVQRHLGDVVARRSGRRADIRAVSGALGETRHAYRGTAAAARSAGDLCGRSGDWAIGLQPTARTGTLSRPAGFSGGGAAALGGAALPAARDRDSCADPVVDRGLGRLCGPRPVRQRRRQRVVSAAVDVHHQHVGAEPDPERGGRTAAPYPPEFAPVPCRARPPGRRANRRACRQGAALPAAGPGRQRLCDLHARYRRNVRSWNIGAERIKGYRSEEAIGLNFSTFYTDEDRNNGLPQRALEQAKSAGVFKSEGWRVRKGGSRYWANVVMHPLYDDGGNVVGFAKVTRDISERKEAEEQLRAVPGCSCSRRRRWRRSGSSTGGIAHDFNNLLTVILGSLEPPSAISKRRTYRTRRGCAGASTAPRAARAAPPR